VFYFDGDGPAPLFGVAPHRRQLHWEGLLIVGRNASVQPNARGFPPLSKNPLAGGVRNRSFFLGFGHAITVCPKTIFFGQAGYIIRQPVAVARGNSRASITPGWQPGPDGAAAARSGNRTS